MLVTLSRVVMDLYRGAQTTPEPEFAASTIRLLRGVIAFDLAIWGSGAAEDGDTRAFDWFAPEVPDSILAAYQAERFPARRGSSDHSRTSHVSARDVFDPAHCPIGVRHAIYDPIEVRYELAVRVVDPSSGILDELVLMRRDGSRPFNESDRQLTQALAPHVQEVRCVNRIRWALHCPDGAPRASYTGVLVDHDGYLRAAGPGAAELVRREWPGWLGGRLPEALRPLMVDGVNGQALYAGRKIVVRTQALRAEVLLKMREKNVLDTLGRREREVIERFAGGATYKEIARDLSLSPSTVSNHLSNAYSKLGVKSKSSLAELVDRMR